jgi:hypothetical protein
MGFGLDLLTLSFTVTLNYNQLQQLTINDCLRLALFFTGLRVSSRLRMNACLVLIYDSVASSVSVVRWLTLTVEHSITTAI